MEFRSLEHKVGCTYGREKKWLATLFLANHLKKKKKKGFLNAPQPQVHKALIIRSYNLHIIIILIKKTTYVLILKKPLC